MNSLAPLPKVPDIASRFAHVRAWVFDLDNTLYPSDCGLWPQIEHRISLYLVEHSGLDGASARALQRYYYQRHGTTLRGLAELDGVHAGDFLEFVHDIDRSSLDPHPALAIEIAKLPGRKLIFTSGSRDHAFRTIEKLGLEGLFEDAFDIVASGLIPKPQAAAYVEFFRAHGVEPTEAAMFEDIARNLAVPKARGMTTVLVTPKLGQIDHRQSHDSEIAEIADIDFVTDDLVGFLEKVNAAREGE